MTSATMVAALALAAALSAPSFSRLQSPRLGGLLEPGMRLVYSSGGVEQSWSIDDVRRDTTLGGREGCIVLRLRTSPTQAGPATRAHCVVGGEMHDWIGAEGRARPARPLGAGELAVPRTAGGWVTFATGAPERDSVGGRVLAVVPTVVTTVDSAGRTIRRLTERFAIELATASRGVFEVPDSTAPNGWRVERAFELVRIERPPR